MMKSKLYDAEVEGKNKIIVTNNMKFHEWEWRKLSWSQEDKFNIQILHFLLHNLKRITYTLSFLTNLQDNLQSCKHT